MSLLPCFQLIFYSDVAVMYPDGRFSVKGRATDSVRFKINMFLIWPSIIESAISTLPGVRSIKVHYLSTLKGLNVCEFIMCVY